MDVPNFNASNLRLLFVCVSGKGKTAVCVCVCVCGLETFGRRAFLTRWEKYDSDCDKSNMDLAELRQPEALLLWLVLFP